MTHFVDGVYVRVMRTRGLKSRDWVVYAKTEPFKTRDDPDASHIFEPGEMWFDFGNDLDALIAGIVDEVKREGSRA